MNDNKLEFQKKYVCFVCAMEFEDYGMYSNHIISEHIRDEEYIICPRCNAPVRDIRLHYKIKHKNCKIPKLSVMKAYKWYDWDFKYKKMKKKKRRFKEGFFHSDKMNKDIHYRSSWERDVMICFEKCQDIIEYYGDNYLSIPYELGGVSKNYWPDFFVKFSNGNYYVIEIKPKDQTQQILNLAKWKFAIQYCSQRGWNFQVWTEKFIKKIKMRASRKDVLLAENILPDKDESFINK